jgi:hypothetical protein
MEINNRMRDKDMAPMVKVTMPKIEVQQIHLMMEALAKIQLTSNQMETMNHSQTPILQIISL